MLRQFDGNNRSTSLMSPRRRFEVLNPALVKSAILNMLSASSMSTGIPFTIGKRAPHIDSTHRRPPSAARSSERQTGQRSSAHTRALRRSALAIMRSVPRIALLSNYPADHATCVGGVETATMGLLEGLQAFQGEFSFHVVTMPSSLRTERSERRDGFQFHFLSAPKAPWARPSLPFRTARAFRELRGIAPDLVHCQDNMALALASILSRRPRLFTVHGVKRHEAGRRTGREAWGARADSMLEPFVYRHFDRFVAISEYARDTVGSTDRSALIPNPVRSLFFEAHARRRPRPLLVFAGVLAPLKRPGDLIAAYAQVVREVPELELVICGSVEDERYALGLRQQVADHGLQRVTFRGQTDQHEMAELLAQATALVLPSAQENAPM